VKTFIIRVYRFEKKNPKSLKGLVEEVGKEGKKGFTCLDELWNILTPALRRKPKLMIPSIVPFAKETGNRSKIRPAPRRRWGKK